MSHTDLTNAEVVDIIQSLARKHHSAALAQLASKITAVLRFGAATGDDPFAKVEGLIQELTDRLVAEVFLLLAPDVLSYNVATSACSLAWPRELRRLLSLRDHGRGHQPPVR